MKGDVTLPCDMTDLLHWGDGKVVEQVPLGAGDVFLALVKRFPDLHQTHKVATRCRAITDLCDGGQQIVVDCAFILSVIKDFSLKNSEILHQAPPAHL